MNGYIWSMVLVVVVLVSDRLECSNYEHLPYALRSRFMSEERSSTKIINSFVTHQIDDIESFFDESSSSSRQLSKPTTAESPPRSANHRHHNANRKHSKLTLSARSSQKLISQKRTVKNNNNNNNNLNQNDYQSNSDYVTATIGKDVQLDCKIKTMKSDDENKIVWLKMPKGEIMTLNSVRVTSDQRVSSYCNTNQKPCWSLVIASTRESDTGFYACQTNEMKSKYIYLDIMVPPKLLTQYPVDRIDVNQSSNASITCEFYGKPQPLVKWFKYQNGQQKEIEKYRGFKTIDIFINPDSPNEYECVADNSIPPIISKKIYLNIQCKPIILIN